MKYIILIASVAIQVCLGGIYAWSALVPAMQESLGLSVAQTQIIFGGLFGAFTLSMVLAGKRLDRLGPRVLAGFGGLLFAAGYLVASYSNGRLGVMILGISLLAGIGTGTGYVCPLATCMKWFPKNRGLVTGISMAGFGGGAILLAAVAEHLLAGGMHVLSVFRWIGLGYGATLLAAASILHFPRDSHAPRPRPAPRFRLLTQDPFFLALVVGMFCGTFAGMLVVGNLKPMALAAGIPALPATAAISVFAVGNATGRIAWGWLSDRTDHRVIPIKLMALAAPLAILPWVHCSALFIAVSFAIGFGFGACFVVYAAHVASNYGPARVGGVYPVVFLSYGVAGIVGPPLGGALYDATSSYGPAIGLSCAIVAAGVIATSLLLRRARESRLLPLPHKGT